MPDVIGTGFAADRPDVILSCAHVAVELQRRTDPSHKAKKRASPKNDAVMRIGIPLQEPGYRWSVGGNEIIGRSESEALDITIFHTEGINVPLLKLRREGQIFLGEEVLIAVYPLGSRLQGVEVRPFVMRAIVAGVYDGPKGAVGPRVVFDTAVAGGLSGGPVVSVRDGLVIGMVSSTMLDGQKLLANLSLGVASTTIADLLDHSIQESVPRLKAMRGNDPTEAGASHGPPATEWIERSKETFELNAHHTDLT